MPSCPVPATQQCEVCKKKGHTKWACHSRPATNVASVVTDGQGRKGRDEQPTEACAAVSTKMLPSMDLNIAGENNSF